MPTAAEYAPDLVASVRDDPAGRLALMRSFYEASPGRPELHLPYRRAALGFMGWQLRRGLLEPLDARVPGSPWWRAVNERLLRDTAEARGHARLSPVARRCHLRGHLQAHLPAWPQRHPRDAR